MAEHAVENATHQTADTDTDTDTGTGAAAPRQLPRAEGRRSRTISDWRPEDEAFWERTGRGVARRNLAWSIVCEHVGFSVWLLWSVSAAFLVPSGFDLGPAQLFLLVAVPNLVGALVRLPYTAAVARFGGRTWTTVSAVLLLVPTVLFALVVQRPGTPYWVLLLVAGTAGLGGGNFASSMANINAFYPARSKGAALGLNAAGGNLGASAVQLLLPVLVGGAGLFGLVAASGTLHLARAGLLYAALAAVTALCAWRFMDDLTVARAPVRDTLMVLRRRQTWVMAFLYVGTFGSFIGYSAAMPLLIRLNFSATDPATGAVTGIDFAHHAFLGALVGSLTRPLGGWLADRYGGARVTAATFAALVLGTLAITWSLSGLAANPSGDPAVALANRSAFPGFLVAFLLVFAATGIGNGSTYRMIPLAWRSGATRHLMPHTPAHDAATARATRESSAALGVVGAVGALGGVAVPMAFGAPWVADPAEAAATAFGAFAAFYVLCLAVTWFVFLRRAFTARVPSLAHARI